MDVEYSWTPPAYNLEKAPYPTPAFHEPFPINDFPRSAKWCYDGSALLAQCEQRSFRVYTPGDPAQQPSESTEPRMSMRTLPQPAPIVDYVWYPTATAANPATFCFVASVRETPVKLLDASDGRLRASYPIVDHRERQIAPHSLSFNTFSTRLYCGFEDAIEVFDISRPGAGTRLHTSPSKKSKDGLKGIISALAFQPSYESDLFAAGSLSASTGNIALFSEAEGAVPVMFIGGGPAAGVTQLHFNPSRPHILYAAFRRHPAIYSWDLRGDAAIPLRVYASSIPPDHETRDRLTNQKRRFDVDTGGRYLGVGDQEGNISIFDVESSEGEAEPHDVAMDSNSSTELPLLEEQRPKLTFTAHKDAIGGVAFHPTRAALVSVCGSRHFTSAETDAELDSSSASSSEDDPAELDSEAAPQTKARVTRRAKSSLMPQPREAAVRLWDFAT
ncbi:WD40-repeat-containing domain protein [Mycena amicta]|nr:WD40-repeat-containing domain protein [Mycena amicta]